MATVRLLSILFLLNSSALWAVGLDASLIHGTAKTYSSLLEQLNKSGKKNDDTALQETLLNRLINLSDLKTPKPITIKTPANEKEYRHLFIQYKSWSLSKTKTQKLIEEIGKKTSDVKEQLLKLDTGTNDFNILSLQLQYVFYTKRKKQATEKLSTLIQVLKSAPENFTDTLKHIQFNLKGSEIKLKQTKNQLAKIKSLLQREYVKRERFQLLDKVADVTNLDTNIQTSERKQQDLLSDEIDELFIQFSVALQASKGDVAFSFQNKLMKVLESLNHNDIQNDIRSLLNTIETSVLGYTETIKGAAIENVKDGLSLFWEKANAPLFTVNDASISALKLALAFFIIAFGFIIGGIYKSYVKKVSYRKSNISSATRMLLANLGYYLTITIAFFIALNIIGINLSSIAIVAGALSVGIGFGLQNIVSNFISGIILMFERSIKVGDFLELEDALQGRVTDIRMRSTTLITNDNIDVIVPNQKLIENQVINWTMNDQIRRFRVPFGVAYGTDVKKVIKVVLKAVGNSGFMDIYTSQQRNTCVIMTGMGDSSVDFLLLVWVKGEKSFTPKRTTSRFLTLIYNALITNGIQIPFPQRDIHVRSIDIETPVMLDKNKEENA